MHAQVSVGIAEHKTAALGDDNGISVAYAGTTEVKTVGAEGDVSIFGDILGIDDKPVARTPAVVEDLGVYHVEAPEVGDDLAEFEAPFREGLITEQHFIYREFGDAAQQLSAGYKYLAAVA